MSNLMVACRQGCDFYGDDCETVIGALEQDGYGKTTGKCYFFKTAPGMGGVYCDATCPIGLFGYAKRSAVLPSTGLDGMTLSTNGTSMKTTTSASSERSDASSVTDVVATTKETTSYSNESVSSVVDLTSIRETSTTTYGTSSTDPSSAHVSSSFDITASAIAPSSTNLPFFTNSSLAADTSFTTAATSTDVISSTNISSTTDAPSSTSAFSATATVTSTMSTSSISESCPTPRAIPELCASGLYNVAEMFFELTCFCTPAKSDNSLSTQQGSDLTQETCLENCALSSRCRSVVYRGSGYADTLNPTCEFYSGISGCTPTSLQDGQQYYAAIVGECSEKSTTTTTTTSTTTSTSTPTTTFTSASTTTTTTTSKTSSDPTIPESPATVSTTAESTTAESITTESTTIESTTTELTSIDSDTTTAVTVETTSSTTSICQGITTLAPQQQCSGGYFDVGQQMIWSQCDHYIYGIVYAYAEEVSYHDCILQCLQDISSQCLAIRYDEITLSCGLFNYKPYAAQPDEISRFAYAQVESNCPDDAYAPISPIPTQNFQVVSCEEALTEVPLECQSGTYNIYGTLYTIVCGHRLGGKYEHIALPYTRGRNYPPTLRDLLLACSTEPSCHGVNFRLTDGFGSGVTIANPGQVIPVLFESELEIGCAEMQGSCAESTSTGCSDVPALNPSQRNCVRGQFYVSGMIFTSVCSKWVYGDVYEVIQEADMAQCLKRCVKDRNEGCLAVRFNTAQQICGLFSSVPQEQAALPDGNQYGFAQLEHTCQFRQILPTRIPVSKFCTSATKNVPATCSNGYYRVDTRLYRIYCGYSNSPPLENGQISFLSFEQCLKLCSQNDDCHAAAYWQMDDGRRACRFGTEPGIRSPSSQISAAYAVLIGTCGSCAPRSAQCENDSDCCKDDVCSAGSCQQCTAIYEACSPGIVCCKPYTCVMGKCQPPCAKTRQACSTDLPCCGDNDCVNNICRTRCARLEEVCRQDADCCTDTKCFQGFCKPKDYCVPVDIQCFQTSECCAGARCFFNECKDANYCQELYDLCMSHEDCCGALICGAGNCCKPYGRDCEYRNECCSGYCNEIFRCDNPG